MRISNSFINFGARYIADAPVIHHKDKPVEASFVELEKGVDNRAVKKICKRSDDGPANTIEDDFPSGNNDSKYYGISLDKLGRRKQKNKLLCVMNLQEVSDPERALSINNMFSAYPTEDGFGRTPKKVYKGAGELCIYQAVKKAWNEGYKAILLTSICNDFWQEKMGFSNDVAPWEQDDDEHDLALKRDQFEPFMKRVEEKYGFERD